MKRLILPIVAVFFLLLQGPLTAAADDIQGHWAEKELRTLVSKGIMNGYPGGTYQPDKNITRAEFAKLVIETLNLVPVFEPEVSSASSSNLTDLKVNEWYYPYVISAVEAGIITGYEDGTFRPSKQITREEMATMIIRALDSRNIPSEPTSINFKDTAQINQEYALVYVQRIVSLGLMKGMDADHFAPKKSSTRAEVATVLVRMLNHLTKDPVVNYTSYNLNFNDFLMKQMDVSPQTDKYKNDKSFVSGTYITNVFTDTNGKNYGYVTGTNSLNVREGAGESYRAVGKIASVAANPTKVEIFGSQVNDKNETWYEINYGTWKNATSSDVTYYLNPNNFSAGSKEYFQFLILSKRAGITANELNNKILAGKGKLGGQGQAFIKASTDHSINEIYLVSHAMLETGNGTSNLSKGMVVDSIVQRDSKGNPKLDVNGQPIKTPVESKTVYNFFGIGALDACAEQCGAERAYQEGWFTPEAAITGGAKFISEMYVNHPIYKQDTLYKMRWNPANPALHQYATDIGWAVKQVERIYQMYQLLDYYTLYYDVPKFK